MTKTPRSIHHDSVLGNEQAELNEMLGTLREGERLINKVQAIFDEIVEAGLLEDRREYGDEDLQEMYSLTGQEAHDLLYLIQREFKTEFSPRDGVNFDSLEAETVKEFIQEAVHGNLDGWENEHDRLVIQRFLDDMVVYCVASKADLPAHAKLDRDGVVAALKASGYDTDADIKSAKFLRMSSNGLVAIYNITYVDNDDGFDHGNVYLEPDASGEVKGEF